MKRVLITGANRGLGLEFTQQCLQHGDMVFAGTRKLEGIGALQTLKGMYPERLKIIRLPVDDENIIEKSVNELHPFVDGLDLLINNAGIFPRDERLGNFVQDTLLTAFRTNSIGPVLVVQAFLNLLKNGENPRVINITSQLGSLTNKSSGGNYSYCASKAALNMFSRALAQDLKSSGIVVIALHPGWVQTDMGGSTAPLTPERSVAGMLDVIANLTPKDTGGFFAWDGGRVPW